MQVMETIKRKVTYRLYPSEKQKNQMVEVLRLHQRLYNAAMDSLVAWYLFGLISWLYLLYDYQKKFKIQYVFIGLVFALTGIFAVLFYLILDAEGVFDDP